MPNTVEVLIEKTVYVRCTEEEATDYAKDFDVRILTEGEGKCLKR